MGDVVKGIGDVVSGAINTVEDVGKAAGQALTGNLDGAVNSLGQAGSDLIKTAANGFLKLTPEGQKLGAAGNILGGLLGQAGGFNPTQGCGLPNPFGQGGFLPGLGGNPFGPILGGGFPGLPGLPGFPGGGGFPGFPGGGGGLPGGGGFPGGGGGAPGGVGGAGESFAQLQQDMQNAVQSGDPMQMFQAQQKFDQYNRMVQFLSTMEKKLDETLSSEIQKLA